MGRILNPYDAIETFLPTIRSVFRHSGLGAGRILTVDDFIQAGYLGLEEHWARFGKDEDPAPSYRLIIFREMVEALRTLGFARRLVVSEPLIMLDAMDIADTTPDLSLNRSQEAWQYDTAVRLIAQLPPKEKMVLRAMLLHGVSQRNIMHRLHVSEGRVSQIRASAVKHLRALLAEAEREAYARRTTPRR